MFFIHKLLKPLSTPDNLTFDKIFLLVRLGYTVQRRWELRQIMKKTQCIFKSSNGERKQCSRRITILFKNFVIFPLPFDFISFEVIRFTTLFWTFMSCLTSLHRQNLKERLKMSLDFNIEKNCEIRRKMSSKTLRTLIIIWIMKKLWTIKMSLELWEKYVSFSKVRQTWVIFCILRTYLVNNFVVLLAVSVRGRHLIR